MTAKRIYTPEQKAAKAKHAATPAYRAAHRERCRRYYAALTPEQKIARVASNRRYYATREGKALNAEWHRRNRYGIEPGEYDALMTAQGNICAVCEEIMSPPHVDHCHETGRVRGLLCGPCNTGAGLLRDDPKRCHALGDYLEAGETHGV